MALIQRTVYIREEDIDKWKAVNNKAEFIHNALINNDGFRQIKYKGVPVKVEPDVPDGVMYMLNDKTQVKVPKRREAKLTKVIEEKEIKLCKHGSAKGLCKKGCKWK